LNLAWRDIRHGLGRFLFTCVGLGLLLAVVLAMIGIYRGLVVDALTIARAPGVDLWVVEANTRGPFAEASRIPGDTREAIARIAGVSAAGSITYQTVETEHGGAKLRLYVIGYEPTRPGGPPEIASGRGIARSRLEMVADSMSGLEPGDRLRLGASPSPSSAPRSTRSIREAIRPSTSPCRTPRNSSSNWRRLPRASRPPAAAGVPAATR